MLGEGDCFGERANQAPGEQDDVDALGVRGKYNNCGGWGYFARKCPSKEIAREAKTTLAARQAEDKGYVGFSSAEVWEARDSVALVTMVDKWATGNQSASMRNE